MAGETALTESLFVRIAGAIALVASCLFAADVCSAASPRRIALVIGNANYPDHHTPLEDARIDAEDVADGLKRLGFEVERGVNLSGAKMGEALARFYAKIKPEDIVLLFYDGFAIQSGRQTYLVPVDAQIWVEKDVVRDGVGLEAILGEMGNRKAQVVIALLEASRSNPYERRFRHYSAGLAPAVTPPNTVVMYSSALGSVISNTAPKRSIFVNELLKEIVVPNAKAEDALKNVQAGVIAITGRQQIPWLSSTLTVPFSFSSQAAGSAGPDKPETKCEPVQADPLPSPDDLAKDPQIRDLTRRLSADPDDKRSRYRRGQVYAIKRAYQLAARDFDAVIKLSPKDAEAFNNRCWTRAAIDDLPAALADCDEALRIAPGAADALDSRGLVYLKMGRTADAIRDYGEALKINPQSASSLFGRGVARMREGADGEPDLALARKIDPGIVKEFAGYGVSECLR